MLLVNVERACGSARRRSSGTVPDTSFVAWDTPRVVPSRSASIASAFRTVSPALERAVEVPLVSGGKVGAIPGWALVRREVDRWTPERAAEITGVPADTIVKVARAFAEAKPAAILMVVARSLVPR